MKKSPFTKPERRIHLQAAIQRRKKQLEKTYKTSERKSFELEIKLLTELKRENEIKIKIEEENLKNAKLF